MMRKLTTLLAISWAVLAIGCEKQASPKNSVTLTEVAPVLKQATAQTAEKEQTDGSIGSQVSSVMNQIGEKSSDAASDVTEMASSLMDDLTTSSTEAAEQTAEWVNSLYEKAKSTGQTTATSAKDWVVDDFQRGGSWQYRVVEAPADATKQQVMLNKLGLDRWECYEVVSGMGGTVFYLKRRSRSVIRSLPARDLLRLLPLLGAGGEE